MAKAKFILLGVLVSAAIFGWLLVGHVRPLLRVAGDLDWRFVSLAIASAVISYAMIGLALGEVLGLLGYRLPFPEVQGIAFVSTTANYFVSSLGASGFALKAHLLRKRNVPYAVTVTASVVSTALMYAVLGVIILEGLVYLLLGMKGARLQLLEGVVGLLLLGAATLPFLIFLFDHEWRSRLFRKIFHWINRVSFYFSKKEIPKEDFVDFEIQLTEGLAKIHGARGRLTMAIVYTCLDWAFTMMVLYFAFRAVGDELSVAHCVTGFAVGQAAMLVPLLPGGLGAMEGSMAAVFERLGSDWNDAMVAVLLYRVAYHVLPGLSSVFLLWGLKVSEPALIEQTAQESLPAELELEARHLQRQRRRC